MMPDSELPDISPQLLLPSWADPYFMSGLYDVSGKTFVVPAGGSGTVAPGNVNRIMLGFKLSRVAVGSALVSVFGDPTKFGYSLLVADDPLWFSLFNFGPLVCYPWNVVGAAAQEIQVVEVQRHG
jgi:hypothetical protein